MGGGSGAKHGWVESEFERLALLDTIFLSMDSDGPGQEAVRDLVERLGRERCRVVNLPLKDANDCLMQDVPRDDMLACLRDSKTCDPSELRSEEHTSELQSLIRNSYAVFCLKKK